MIRIIIFSASLALLVMILGRAAISVMGLDDHRDTAYVIRNQAGMSR